MLEAKLRRVGSSLGILLPKKALDAAGLQEGDAIVIPHLGRAAAKDLYGVWRARPVELLG